MKKLLLFAAAATMFAGCSQDTTEDVAMIPVPDRLQVSIADNESRMQLSDDKTVWTAGDKVSVFYKSDANQCWRFDGKTGDRSGTLSQVSAGTATATMEKVVIVYPYSESYIITPSSGNIEAKLPAVQTYASGSYGLASSPMIASGYYTQFALKNVCGWLKLQFTGTGSVTKIFLKGNNNEQLAGDMYIDAETAEATLSSASVDSNENQVTGGTLVFEDSIVREVELDCTGGVDLSAAGVTPFYIALPPMVLEKGFTATVHFDNGTTKTIATSKRIEIERNHIVPMSTTEISVPEYDNIDIKYVTSNKRIINNSAENPSWWAAVVSNTYDTENNIGTLSIPKGSSIGNNAFRGVTGLLSIEIPDNMKGAIGDGAFWGCTALKNIKMSKNTTIIKGFAFQDCKNLVADIVIPNGQKTIFQHTFCNCDKLRSITIPDSITSIGLGAFHYCGSLKYIAIPNNVTTIGDRAFTDCTSLTSINIPYGVTSIGDYAFSGCSSLTSVVIGNGVSEIGDCAFFGCSSLTCINIPDSVTAIGNSAFHNCSNLTSITIPDSVTTIGDSAFTSCSSLTSVTIPDSVTSIGGFAFSYCSSLTSINIPDGVTSIGNFAFSCCNSLSEIYCKPTTPPSLEGYLGFNGMKIYVPMQSVDAYKAAWSSYADKIVGYDF